MCDTLEQFCSQTFHVEKRSAAKGRLRYKLVLKNGVLHIEVLENLDHSGKSAGGTYTKGPVSLEKILAELKGEARVSGDNNNAGFWRAILEHQGIIAPNENQA